MLTESLGLPTQPECSNERDKIDIGDTVQSLKPT